MDNNGSLNTHLLIGSCEDENTENLGLRDGPKWRKKELLKELKKQLSLGGPLVMANLLQRCMQNVSVMFVGHLGELPLAGASLATSFANAVGFSVLSGMAGALDTLCGQAYGAKQYHMIGLHTQRAQLIFLTISIPIALILYSTEEILQAVGQDVELSKEAGIYSRWMIPSIFAYSLLQTLTKFLQTQNITSPIMLTTAITTLLHLPICWILVSKSGLGNKGAALANSVSYFMNVMLLTLYMKFSSTCTETWTGFSKEAFQDTAHFFRIAIPSTIMGCTRVSNELGAGNPCRALFAVRIVFLLITLEGLLVGGIILLVRNVWGYYYSNEQEVVDYVSSLTPLLAFANIVDGIQYMLSSTTRGCGRQNFGALANLGGYYGVGIPMGIILGFIFHFGAEGLWMRIMCGSFVQGLSLLIMIINIDWEQEVSKIIGSKKSVAASGDHIYQIWDPKDISNAKKATERAFASRIPAIIST